MIGQTNTKMAKNERDLGILYFFLNFLHNMYCIIYVHSVCDRSGLWPFWFVAVPVCGRVGHGLSVCGRYDQKP